MHGSAGLLPGTLEMLILRVLQHKALHGYAIAQRLKEVSQDVLQVGESSLYPALQRLLLNGFVDADHTPTTLELTLDVSALPSWTKIEVFNYANLVLTLPASPSLSTELKLNVPISRRGIYGFSALVTLSDGQTLSTSNLLAYSAVPEPSAAILGAPAIVFMLICRRRASRRRRREELKLTTESNRGIDSHLRVDFLQKTAQIRASVVSYRGERQPTRPMLSQGEDSECDTN